MKYISFAIPCYNSEAYMEKAINSILIGGEDVEILIVNDGSKDGTQEIAERYEAQYPTIVKAIQKENAGETGVYYWKKKEARDLFESAGVQFPGGSMQDGLIHSILNNDSHVNINFMLPVAAVL